MKNFEKSLHYSKKLEKLQTDRKSKEVDEVHKIDIQMESHTCHELDRILAIDHTYNQHLKQELEELLTPKRQWAENKIQELLEAEKVEQQAQQMRINTSGNDFEIIAEIQGVIFEEPQSYGLKQLPEGSPGMFDHDLSDLTETQFQQELDQNEMEITQGQGPGPTRYAGEKDGHKNLFFFRPQVPGPK